LGRRETEADRFSNGIFEAALSECPGKTRGILWLARVTFRVKTNAFRELTSSKEFMSTPDAESNDLTRRSEPLSGLIVADFSRVLAGPLATMMLGDLGAMVIKVERPERGDDTRAWGPPFAEDGTSTYYLSVNRNKQSVRLDLRNPDDLRLARELARRADVLIENFKPGTMDAYGLGYEELVVENPGLIYCSISGFGLAGGRDLPGYDFLAQAAGGLMSITGLTPGEPTKTGVAVGDVVTGLFSTIGILAALVERSKSGRGQKVETNLLQSVLASLVNHASGYLVEGVVPETQGNAHSSIAPYETVRARDGEIVIAVGNDRQFERLCSVLELNGLPARTEYSSNSARVKNRDTLHRELEARIAMQPATHWLSLFADAGVPSGKVNDIGEAFSFADHLGLVATYSQLESGIDAVRQVANPITLSATPAKYWRSPPGLGEHDEEVRSWLTTEWSRPTG
jgi:crotonobetainyl-CoA:carnitine CoA-transferase CaiB-like acyl-CoA transferase